MVLMGIIGNSRIMRTSEHVYKDTDKTDSDKRGAHERRLWVLILSYVSMSLYCQYIYQHVRLEDSETVFEIKKKKPYVQPSDNSPNIFEKRGETGSKDNNVILTNCEIRNQVYSAQTVKRHQFMLFSFGPSNGEGVALADDAL